MKKHTILIYNLCGIIGGIIAANIINFIKIENMMIMGESSISLSFAVLFCATTFIYINIISFFKSLINVKNKIISTKIQILNVILYLITLFGLLYIFLSKSISGNFLNTAIIEIIISVIGTTIFMEFFDIFFKRKDYKNDDLKSIRNRIFNISDTISIMLPKNWIMEEDPDDGHIALYPDNSDLTIRIKPYEEIVKDDGEKVPVSELIDAYYKMLDIPDLKEEKIDKIKDYTTIANSQYMIQDNQKVFALYLALIKPGELIIIDIFALDKDEVFNTLKYIRDIQTNIKERIFYINDKISITLPSNWRLEIDQVDEHTILYPNDSDLTVRIMPYNIPKNKKKASIKDLEDVYYKTLNIPISDLKKEKIGKIKGYTTIANSQYMIQDDQEVFSLYLALIKPRELIIIDIFAIDKDEVFDCLKYIKNIKIDK